jgi:cytochrome b
MKKVKLWDAPLRIFHWSLVVLVSAAFFTGLTGGGWMDWHGWLGGATAGLIGFRLAWGIVGSTYARFASFIRGPATIAAYLKGEWQGLGHNPLGALSVIGMLVVLSLQVISGLFANDDIAYRGPYNGLIGEESEALALYLHNRIYWLIAALVGLHLGAIAFYARAKGENLVKPMLTGEKEVPLAAAPSAMHDAAGGGWRSLAIAVAMAALFAWLAFGGPVEYLAPPAPPPVATPDW